jgi:hypothetical protein
MSDTNPIDIAAAWFRHVTDRDIDAVMALAADEVEVGGASGSGSRRELLRDWVEPSGAQL